MDGEIGIAGVYVVNNNEDLWQKQKNLMRTAAFIARHFKEDAYRPVYSFGISDSF